MAVAAASASVAPGRRRLARRLSSAGGAPLSVVATTALEALADAASLAAVSPKFPKANAAFWDQLAISKELHHIKKVILLDHRDCGAYKVAFGKEFAAGHNAETAQHKSVMESLKVALAQMHPDLGAEFYLMALDGKAERIL